MDPLCDTPAAVTKSLAEHGGLNPYGLPYWRIVLSHRRLSKKRGLWHEFPDGSWEQFTPDGHGKFQHNPLTATRVVDEVRETPKWPRKGWVLERWFPAEVWWPFPKQAWDSNTGPYPEEGDYYLMLPLPGFQWDEIPELNDLKQGISLWERDYLERPRDFDMAYAMFVAEERAQEEEEHRKMME